MLIIVLIAIIVVTCGNDKDLVSSFSLGGALVGGMLATFVLFYTLLDSSDVRANLNEMKGLIADVKGETVKTSGSVNQMLNNLSQYLSDKDKSEPETEKTKEQESLEFKRRSALIINCALSYLIEHSGNFGFVQSIIDFRNELLDDIKTTNADFISKYSQDIAFIDMLFEERESRQSKP